MHYITWLILIDKNELNRLQILTVTSLIPAVTVYIHLHYV